MGCFFLKHSTGSISWKEGCVPSTRLWLRTSNKSALIFAQEIFYKVSQGVEFCSFCCCSVTKSCPTLCEPMNCSTPDFPVLHYPLKFAQVHVHWVSDTIQPSHPLLPPSPLPSIFPSMRVFSNELDLCIRWLKYWSFSFRISPFNEYSGLISFRIDGFNLLAVQGTLKSLLQHCSLKASILQCSAFFMVQFLDPYITTGKTIALTIQIFVSKMMSLLFSMLPILLQALLIYF